IIPIKIAKEYESRKPILTIPHTKITELTSLLLEASDIHTNWSLIKLLRPTNLSNFDFDSQDNLSKTRTRPHHSNYEFVGHPVTVSTQDTSCNPANHIMPRKTRKAIFNIFKKLRKMFLRYDKQKAEHYAHMQVSNRIDMKQVSMDNNLRR
ncbi:MAG: hypothetical protein GY775_15030, partial [Candidatus Scalindua sp.]|nr:hypothetical protein [Candidatus Scalindua sp.]